MPQKLTRNHLHNRQLGKLGLLSQSKRDVIWITASGDGYCNIVLKHNRCFFHLIESIYCIPRWDCSIFIVITVIKNVHVPHRYHLYEGLSGPKASISVEMSLALTFSPATLSLFLLSYIIHAPSNSVKTVPAAPNAAVVIRAGKYFGASLSRKMLDLFPVQLAHFIPRGNICSQLTPPDP